MRELETLFVFSLLCFGFVYVWSRSSSNALPLPPGPKTNWFGTVGDLPDLKVRPWLTYAQWKETFGDFIYISVWGNPILVLNSATVSSDLLEKRGVKYSSRPPRTMIVDLIGWDWLVSAFPYGSNWQKHRMMFHRHLPQNESSIKYHPLQIEEARGLCRDLLHKPRDFRFLIRKAAATIVLRIAYGLSVVTDEYISLADKALASLAQAGIFGTFLVDYIPILKHAPSWFSFKQKALEWRKPTRAMRDLPFAAVKEHIAQGRASTCLVSEELERLSSTKHTAADESIIANVASTMFAAGADTVVSSLSAFFLVMSLYPEVQAKAQADLDSVLGQQRLPNFTDRPQLPFIDYICYEVTLLWYSSVNLALMLSVEKALATCNTTRTGTLYLRFDFHYPSTLFITKEVEEDQYNGFRIPRGTTVLPNVWAILHDPEMYPNPLTFNPWRFCPENRKDGLNQLPDPAFGFGRRFCPGKHLALDTLWIVVASTLAVFNITKELDENGQVKEPTTEFTPHSLSHPLPFGCTILPRSASVRQLVELDAEM
ncbi:cytochrome P450 [Mycena amicta]|nr:cytochrome P450 [Mycena amicta]